MFFSFLHGLMIGAGLIVAIGAQNAFVLRQGLRREHGWWVAGVCAVCDLLLIAAGVMGLGRLVTSSAVGLQMARWGGVAWLLWQAWSALRRAARVPVAGQLSTQALTPDAASVAVSGDATGKAATTTGMTFPRLASPGAVSAILAALGVTLLNPHVYLDTVVMLGVIGGQQPSPVGFVLGASVASLAWFFGLVGLGHWLSPWLAQPRWWRLIDLFVAVVMLFIAWQLAVTPL